MNIKPLFNQILVQPEEQKTILKAETSFLMYGTVLAIGDQCTQVKVGDTVCYTLWGLNHIEIDGTKHYFVPELPEFLLAILEKESVSGSVVA